MRGDDALRIGADLGAVEVEVHDALRQQLARRTHHRVRITREGFRVFDTAGVGGLRRWRFGSRWRFGLATREQRESDEQSDDRSDISHWYTCLHSGNVHG